MEVEVDLPEEPLYLFYYGDRKAVKLTPVWTTRNKDEFDQPEEIWKYNVVSVDDYKSETKEVVVSSIGRPYPQIHKEQLTILGEIDPREIRTKKEFIEDLAGNFKELLSHGVSLDEFLAAVNLAIYNDE